MFKPALSIGFINSGFIYSAVFINSSVKIRSLIIYQNGSMLGARNEKAAS